MPATPSPRSPAVLRVRADDPRNHAAYALAAELRAVEDGHHAWAQPDGSILVKADSARARRPGAPTALGARYRVRVEGVEDGLVILSCTCRSGFHRHRMPIPCKHAALAARRLEREGFLRWDHGWRSREPLPATGADLPEQHRRFRRSVLTSLRRPLLLAEHAA
jgi:SWIM zinc finger